MLVVTRRAGESLLVGEGIVVTVVSVKGGAARIGIDAPADLRIVRQEVAERVRGENLAAARAAAEADGAEDVPLAELASQLRNAAPDVPDED